MRRPRNRTNTPAFCVALATYPGYDAPTTTSATLAGSASLRAAVTSDVFRDKIDRRGFASSATSGPIASSGAYVATSAAPVTG